MDFPRIAAARRFASLATVTIVLTGCGTTAPPAPPKGEWAPTNPAKQAQPIVLWAHRWKTIEPGRTTRAEVERHFKLLAQAGTPAVKYRIDQIDALIAYDPSDKVATIRVPPAELASPADLRERFGAPDQTRDLPGGSKALDYDRARLAI